jgi:hypothetical protein
MIIVDDDGINMIKISINGVFFLYLEIDLKYLLLFFYTAVRSYMEIRFSRER